MLGTLRTFKSVFLLAFLASCTTAPVWAQKSYKDLKYPPMGELKIPEVKREVLPNGMIVFLAEDHQLPLIELSAKIRTGSVYEPADKAGLAEITGSVMRTGGAGKRSGDQIDDELERLGASVETWIGSTEGGASMSVLKEDVDKGLSILADILQNPQFDQDKIDLAKVEQKSGISRRNDFVGGIASREFDRLIYGPTSPYARTTEYYTIDNIKREDLIAFHQKYYHPNSVILGVWGDFKTAEMLQKIRRAFASWQPSKVEGLELPKVDYQYRSSVDLVKKDDVNQSNIYLGHIGGLMGDPDYFALTVMNSIFGRSFSSRLFKKVRSEEGLAYSVSGAYNCGFGYPGTFYVLCETKSQSTVEAIRYMMEEVKRLTQEEVTDEELNRAKEGYLNSFAFKFDTKDKVVGRLMTYEYYGFPLDFLQKTRSQIEKVTKADILRAAKSHLRPDELIVLAVGKSQDFDQPLSVLGKVDTIDISIPEASPLASKQTPPASEASLAKGKEIFDKVVAACGGKEAFAAIKSEVLKTETTISMPQGDIQISATITYVFPDKVKQEVTTAFGSQSLVFDGEKGWASGPQGSQDLPESQLKETKADLFRSLINLFRSADLKIQYVGDEDFEGKKLNGLLISNPGGNELRMYVDPTAYLPVREAYRGSGMMGPADMEEVFSDFRDASGVKLPFHHLTNADGKKLAETKVTEIKPNVQVDPSLFIKK
ncbi:MAG: pitrilysin family protein [Candidatus Zixiibacteriota bacterium]